MKHPKKCIVCQKTRPVYGIIGEKIAYHCAKCKLPDMENIKDTRCIQCNKGKAQYCLPNENKIKYCSQCKSEDMIKLYAARCLICNKNASYGYENDKKPTYCSKCKLTDMVILRKRLKCIVCNINCRNFGYPNETPKYCSKCKLPGMENIYQKKCVICKKITSSFGYETDKIPLYCRKCKPEGVVNLTNKMCVVCNKTVPHFGLPNTKTPTHCKSCKLPEMQDVKNKKCIICNNKFPVYGIPNTKIATHCKDCKQCDMENIRHPKCKSEWCNSIISNKFKGYCKYCYIHLFPDEAISKNYKTKELSVVKFVKDNFNDFNIQTDKIIENGCSRRRPDILIDLGYQVIIVEIDENQHINYDCSCENKRMMELSVDVGHRPIIFIRFNPDSYKKSDKNILSPWTINSLGICCLKKNGDREWNKRLTILKEQINYWTQYDNKTTKIIEIVQLFYDE